MTNTRKSLLAGLCALACAHPALAQISVRTSIGNLTYTLTDLDPNDGIAPSLMPLASAPRASTSMALTITNDGVRNQYIEHMINGTMPLDPVSDVNYYASSDGTPPTRLAAAASVSGGSLSDLALEASAYNNASAGDHIAASLAATNAAPFVLSPMTLITFSMDYAIHDAIGPLPLDAPLFSTYSAVSFIFLVQEEYSLEYVADSVTYFGGRDSYGTAGPGTLNVSYANREAVGLTSYMTLNAWANATTNIPMPVPEPMTYAMLLAGLGIVVGARRRA
ncbi:MAG TPA: PEP-CTERM sorting domain-containing protein [Telluria sp.]|jgi:hypothetical protein